MDNFTHCHLCGLDFISYKGLALHLRQRHPDVGTKEYYDRFYRKPGEGICLVCGKPTRFIGRLNRGYSKHCSFKCRDIDPETDRQRKLSTLRNHGDENYRNTEQARQTKLEKYNDEYFNNSEQSSVTKSRKTAEDWEQIQDKSWKTRKNRNDGEWISEKTKLQIKITKKEKYGNENYNNRISSKNTCMEKYGCASPGAVPTIRKKITETRKLKILENDKKKYGDRILDIVRPGILLCHCDRCNTDFSISRQTLNNRIETGLEPCTNCNPYWSSEQDRVTSKGEKDIVEFIKSNYVGPVVENDRAVLGGRELDIYLSEKNLAIEFDGLYWHNELNKENDYHLRKTVECEKRGIRLVHIFEDEWEYRRDIVESRLKSLLGICDRIYARKCELRAVSSKEASDFLDINHLQGAINSKYRYGLYYGGELVSLMTFGKSRFGKEFELHRFCNRLGLTVVGGASCLFRRFMKDHPEIREIITFADRRWSDGGLYRTLGFEFDRFTEPSYYYVIDGNRHNRIEFQKHKLVKEGYDSAMSEHEIMLSREIYRIYDCGNYKFKFSK